MRWETFKKIEQKKKRKELTKGKNEALYIIIGFDHMYIRPDCWTRIRQIAQEARILSEPVGIKGKMASLDPRPSLEV